MRFHTLKRILSKCTNEFYFLEKGVRIIEPQKTFRFRDILFTRQQIKHIVEQRKAEGKSAEEIKQLLAGVLETIRNCDFEIPNTNQSDHPGSVMRVKMFGDWERGIVVILDESIGTTRDVISAFFRRPQHIHLLRKKKLQKPASGETPHP